MVNSNKNIEEEKILFFAAQFMKDDRTKDFNMLKHIPKLISDDHNEVMNAYLQKKK